MQHVIVQLGKDFLANDFTACRGVLDYLINERGYTCERLISFLQDVYFISEEQAIEILDILDFLS